MKLWVLALLMLAMNAQAASFDPENLEGYKNLTVSEVQALESQYQGRFEWQSAEFYLNITPRIFLRRSALEPDIYKYLNLTPNITSNDIAEIWEYVQRDEFYKHEFSTLEKFLAETRFGGKQFIYNQIPTKAPFEIEANFRDGLHLLEKYDANHNTTYAQKYVLAYLKRRFQQIRGPVITDLNNKIVENFITNMTKYETGLSREILEVSHLAIKYYRAKMTETTEIQRRIIHSQLLAISKNARKLAPQEEASLLTKQLENTYREESEIENKKSEMTYAAKAPKTTLSQDVSAIRSSMLEAYLTTFIQDALAGTRTSTDLLHEDTVVRVSVKKYSPHSYTTQGNVITLGRKQPPQELVFNVTVAIPGPKSSSVITQVTKFLLAHPQNIYGVYFDDQLRVPSAIKSTDYEMTSIGKEILIRNKPLSCEKLF